MANKAPKFTFSSIESLKNGGHKLSGDNTKGKFGGEFIENAVFLPISEIKENPLNYVGLGDTDEQMIELANAIHSAGKVLVVLHAYLDDDDGKYTLIDGHRRFRASQLLVNRDPEWTNLLPVVVVDKPNSKSEELDMIDFYNAHRVIETEEQRYWLAVNKYEYYLALKAEGKKPELGPREYVSKELKFYKISEKEAQLFINRYKNKDVEVPVPQIESHNESADSLTIEANAGETASVEKPVYSSADMELIKRVENELKDYLDPYGLKLKTNKKGVISLSISCNDLDALPSLLNCLGITLDGIL